MTERQPLPVVYDDQLDLSPPVVGRVDIDGDIRSPFDQRNDCTDDGGHVFVSKNGAVQCQNPGCGKTL